MPKQRLPEGKQGTTWEFPYARFTICVAACYKRSSQCREHVVRTGSPAEDIGTCRYVGVPAGVKFCKLFTQVNADVPTLFASAARLIMHPTVIVAMAQHTSDDRT